MNYKKTTQTILVLLMGVLFSNCQVSPRYTSLGKNIAKEETQQNRPSLLELKGACQNKVPSACFLLAGRYFKGKEVTMNIVRAKKYFSIGCTLGDKKACELSLGMDKMMEETNTKYTTGCAKGIVEDCATMGLISFRGQIISRDWVKARAYMTKACNKKDKMSCDFITGLNIIEKNEDNCNKGTGKDCMVIAGLYIKGDMEGEPNFEEGMRYLTKACDSRVSDGCSFIAKMYIKGMGVRPNIQKAAHFLEKACDRGDANTCMMLGNKYEEGNRVKKDIVKAKKLYKKACDLGEKSGCLKLKKN